MSRPTKKRRLSPSDASMSVLRETRIPPSQLGGAQVVKAKCNELIHSSKSKHQSQIRQTLLRELKSIIENIPVHEALPIEDAERRLLHSKIVIPFPEPRPRPDAQYKLAYARPANINVAGGFALKTAIAEQSTIDLVVTMPSTLFTEKDYLNYRYFHKRAFYLASIAAGIQESQYKGIDQRFSYHNGNPLHPIIAVEPKSLDSDNASTAQMGKINILLATERDTFPMNRTLPNRNNVRIDSDNGNEQSAARASTELYNASIRSDTLIGSYLKLLHRTAEECESFRDACILARAWMERRGFGSSIHKGGFGHFEWAVTMALLLERRDSRTKPVLLSSYDAFDMFRATLRFFAMRDLTKDPITGGMSSLQSDQVQDLPMIFDSERGMNILYRMTPWSYAALSQEAQVSASMLSNSLSDCFRDLFVAKVGDPLLKYDLAFDLPEEPPRRSDLPHWDAKKLYRVLKKGLARRTLLLNIRLSPSGSWAINTARPMRLDTTNMTVELKLETSKSMANKIVDRGPSVADVTERAIFREFWGEKVEIRRFNDGEIVDAVVWAGETAEEKITEIVTYLTRRHLPSALSAKLAPRAPNIKKLAKDLGISLHLSKDDVDSNNLAKALRALPNLPLQIRHIESCGMDETDNQVENMIIQFEGSGRWPNDLCAVQMTKTAFLLKLQENLHAEQEAMETRMGLENENHETMNRSFLDVQLRPQTCLRLRIYHEREYDLLERLLKAESTSSKEKQNIADAFNDYKRLFQHRAAVHRICLSISGRHAAFQPALNLVRAWFNAHFLGGHFKEPLIELLVAKVFVNPRPWMPPATASTGLLRTLVLLAEWDWQHEPLIIDHNAELDSSTLRAIQTRFAAWRQLDPLMNRMCLFVATPHDIEGTTWTVGDPRKVVAARMTSLAKAACEMIYSKGHSLQLQDLFKSSLRCYDFVIQLSPKFCGTEGNQRTSDELLYYKNFEVSLDADKLSHTRVTKIAVSNFVQELRTTYGRLIVFFYNSDGGSDICGLWDPDYVKRNWKVSLPYSTIPLLKKETQMGDGEQAESGVAEDPNDAIVNRTAILAEISRLGGDIIRSITCYI